MPYIIVIQTASQEYSYWPAERTENLPKGYEPYDETFDTPEEAVAWIQNKYQAEEEERLKQENQDKQNN